MVEHERALYAFVFTLVGDRDAAGDCVQDTFVRAHQNLCRGKDVTPAWLYTVARHRAMDEHRQRRRAKAIVDELERLPASQPSDDATSVWAVLNLLAPVDRDVLFLSSVAGYTTDEIGSMLGVRGTAIRQRMYRARRRFKRLYKQE
jgi:RNA polymerase sigma-70 factor (ECF subfamily)